MDFGRFARFAAVGLLLSTVPAAAQIAEFYGAWSNQQADASGIVRIVVTPGDGQRMSIHLFGRCQPRDCDWGVQPARGYTDDPGSQDIHSIAADFDAGGMRKRIVLRIAVGHALRFEVQTDFADGSPRSNYATSGVFAYAGDWNTAARVASVMPPPVASATANTPPSAMASEAAAPVPVEIPEGTAASSSGPSFLGIGPAVASGYIPAAGEDCRPFNPDQVRVGYVDGQWRLGDFANRLLTFGPQQQAARVAMSILAYYHFDEQCFVDRATMIYWKRAGQVPKPSMRGEDCTALDPAHVQVESDGDTWRVVSGGATLLEYDGQADAQRAASVIQTYKLNRQCFFARDASKAQYWLAQ